MPLPGSSQRNIAPENRPETQKENVFQPTIFWCDVLVLGSVIDVHCFTPRVIDVNWCYFVSMKLHQGAWMPIVFFVWWFCGSEEVNVHAASQTEHKCLATRSLLGTPVASPEIRGCQCNLLYPHKGKFQVLGAEFSPSLCRIFFHNTLVKILFEYEEFWFQLPKPCLCSF